MYYYGARYYDPRISIFISVDPLAEETMTPYQYCGNNPIIFRDSTGMERNMIDGSGDEFTSLKEATLDFGIIDYQYLMELKYEQIFTKPKLKRRELNYISNTIPSVRGKGVVHMTNDLSESQK